MNVNESPDEFMVYPMCQYSWNEIFSMDPLKKILECVGTRMHIFLEKKSKVNGQGGHLQFQITPKSNNTSSEPLEDHLWQVW